jgi:hypothetical protein
LVFRRRAALDRAVLNVSCHRDEAADPEMLCICPNFLYFSILAIISILLVTYVGFVRKHFLRRHVIMFLKKAFAVVQFVGHILCTMNGEYKPSVLTVSQLNQKSTCTNEIAMPIITSLNPQQSLV